jgi:NAD(P)-dependent dehydrogenase (short-subunit alcohol dehydrogenase family)
MVYGVHTSRAEEYEMEINGARAIVTGAGRGLGKCLVKELLGREARHVYAAARESDSLDQVVAADSNRVTPVVLDITDDAQAGAAAKKASDVNLVFNNAGIMAFGTPLDADLDLLERAVRTNYVGTLRVMRAFTPVLKVNGGSAFVNIVSLVALAPITSMSPYSASKAATHSMTQAVRHQLADCGIRVLGVYPAGMNTDMMAGVDAPKAQPENVARSILDGVEANVEDIMPDEFSSSAFAGWRADPKAFERQLAAL